jgi:hypothetical protein
MYYTTSYSVMLMKDSFENTRGTFIFDFFLLNKINTY